MLLEEDGAETIIEGVVEGGAMSYLGRRLASGFFPRLNGGTCGDNYLWGQGRHLRLE